MNAFILKRNQGIGILEMTELPIPELKPEEVLIKTKALDINPVDNKTLQGKGQYERIKTDEPVILGWGLSGEVVEVGSAVTNFQKGDDVFGLIRFPGHGKAYAEYVAAPANELALKPASVSHEEAAATTLSALTAYQIIQTAAIKNGERVFVQGAAGGVGFFTVQMAKHLGAYVIGTAKAADKARLTAAGLNELIDYQTTDFEKAVTQIDMALDTLGNEYAVKALSILKPGGRLITIPSGGSEEWKTVASQKGLQATFLFVHSSGADMQVVAQWLGEGIIKPNIVHQFGFDRLPQVHQLMSDKKISGKIIVSL